MSRQTDGGVSGGGRAVGLAEQQVNLGLKKGRGGLVNVKADKQAGAKLPVIERG